VVSVVSMCLYGNFASRYVFEPLVGMALLLAPALAPAGRRKLLLLIPVVLWQSTSSLFPDAVYSSRPVRAVANVVDGRFSALHYVTRLRQNEWETFAGRTPHEWHLAPEMRLVRPGDDRACGQAWRSKGYWRTGNPLCLQCDTDDHFVFTRSEIWEWNVWYWRTIPAQKGAGIHVRTKADRWEVHPGGVPRDHDRCFFVVSKPVTRRPLRPHRVVERWIADAPECMNHRIVASWLLDVWSTELGCPWRLSDSSFTELELGRLLVRDDGWLDRAELTYLRAKARTVTPKGKAP
jgi:hypothetical protein